MIDVWCLFRNHCQGIFVGIEVENARNKLDFSNFQIDIPFTDFMASHTKHQELLTV